jgi:uncharacterized protein
MISDRLALMNPWWTDSEKFIRDDALLRLEASPVFFKNPLLDTLPLTGRPFHIIRGPRQVGKTTFLKLLIKKALVQELFKSNQIAFFSCESLEKFSDMIATIEPWLLANQAAQPLMLLLDEVSFVSEWQRAILHFENLGLFKNTTLIVTGSNARDLKESSEKFPGRRHGGLDLSFYPLSPKELATLPAYQNLSPNEILELYELIGGFPHAVASYHKFGYVTVDVYETYRNWIVGDAARYKLHEETLKHILYRILICAPHRITWPQLIENTPIKSHETALEYVEHLQDAFICRIVFCYNPDKNGPDFHKARKLFFIDPLLYYVAMGWMLGHFDLREIVPNKLLDQPFRAKIFESYAATLLSRTEPIYFWYSTKEKKEVDIVRSNKQPLELWDCKISKGSAYKAMQKDLTVKIMTPTEFAKVINL